MSFTFSGSIASDRDWVRLKIGDTNSGSYYLEDETIDYLLSSSTNLYLVASEAADSIAAKLSREATRRVGDLSINSSEVFKAYKDLAVELKMKSFQSNLVFQVTGSTQISGSSKFYVGRNR